MRYFSTRGSKQNTPISFEQVVFEGLADDSGLFIPTFIPKVEAAVMEQWQNLTFQKLALNIFRLYIDEVEIPTKDLEELINNSYARFDHEQVTPLVHLNDNLWLLELFHGPTLAFKDVALQFLGNLFEYFLKKNDRASITVLGATSGDTGSAAIYGLRGKEKIKTVILFPEGRISTIQEKQMTTVLESNVMSVAVKGSFDDCQNIVKKLFARREYKKRLNLAAINSINWARIMAQIKLTKDEISFSVPSGNFGDALAGYYAKRMGLRIKNIIVATNSNDILYRFFQSGEYRRTSVQPTLAPAMDIQVSSNFERLVCDLMNNNTEEVKLLMQNFEKTNSIIAGQNLLSKAKEIFLSFNCNDSQASRGQMNYLYYDNHDVLLDPHTCVGVYATKNIKGQVICLATAHPVKFPDAVVKVVQVENQEEFFESKNLLPKSIKGIQLKKSKKTVLDNDENTIADLIENFSQQ